MLIYIAHHLHALCRRKTWKGLILFELAFCFPIFGAKTLLMVRQLMLIGLALDFTNLELARTLESRSV